MQGSKPGKYSRMDGEDQWNGDLDLMHGHWEMQQNCRGSPKYRFLSVQDSEHCTSACFCLALGWSGLSCFACIMQPLNSPTVFCVQNTDWAGMCKPLQPWLSHARLCSSHTLLQALSRGSLLQQVPSEPQLHWCLSSATSSSCLPSVASHPAKLCPGLEMTKCPLVNCRTDRLELKVLIYMTMALTAQ